MLTQHRVRNGKVKTKGGPLDREVNAARQKEIQHLSDMEVYEDVIEAEARARSGRTPVGLKWIDTNKKVPTAPRYRSRLVCMERSSRQHLR